MKPILLSLLLVLPLTLVGCGGSKSDHAADDGHGHAEKSTGQDVEASKPEAAGEESHGEEEGHVELSEEQLRASGVKVEAVGPGTIRETLPLYGVIAPNAERVQQVSARFPGAIRSVSGKIGDQVSRGQVLAEVESDESLRTVSITAPLAGVITARDANPGEQSGSRVLFTVADLSTVWVELSLFPRDLSKAKVGQKVLVKSVDAALTAEGTLVYVSPIGSNASQTVSGRVLLDNSERKWAPGLYVSAQVTIGEEPAAVTVRNTAIQSLEDKTVVFVQGGPGEFEPRPVQVGRSDGSISEVLSGLKPGERYVTEKSFVLKSQLGAGSAEHGH